MSLSQLACESGKARWCLMQWTSAYSMAVLAAICRVSNRTNSLHPGFDKDKKKYAYSSQVVVVKDVDIYI